MEGQSGATGLQLNVISFQPKLTRAKEISSGGGNGTAFGISMNKNMVMCNIATTYVCPVLY